MSQHRVAQIVAIATAAVLANADVHAVESAAALLAQAEVAVASAREKQALWLGVAKTVAEARAALARGDEDESARLSRRAIELSELGVLQRGGGTGPAGAPVRRDR